MIFYENKEMTGLALSYWALRYPVIKRIGEGVEPCNMPLKDLATDATINPSFPNDAASVVAIAHIRILF